MGQKGFFPPLCRATGIASWAKLISSIFSRRRRANLVQINAANGLRPQPINAAVEPIHSERNRLCISGKITVKNVMFYLIYFLNLFFRHKISFSRVYRPRANLSFSLVNYSILSLYNLWFQKRKILNLFKLISWSMIIFFYLENKWEISLHAIQLLAYQKNTYIVVRFCTIRYKLIKCYLLKSMYWHVTCGYL